MDEDSIKVIIQEHNMDLVNEAIRHNIYFGLLVAVVIAAFGFLVYQLRVERTDTVAKDEKNAQLLAEKNKEITRIQEKHNDQILELQKETLGSINAQVNMTSNIEKLVGGVLDRVEKGFERIENKIENKK